MDIPLGILAFFFVGLYVPGDEPIITRPGNEKDLIEKKVAKLEIASEEEKDREDSKEAESKSL